VPGTQATVTGLSWTSSDATVVSLSTADPLVLTAVAAGHVTITAGTGSADVTVSAVALAPGTVIWSNPGNGSGVDRIVPAVPSANGVADVFAFQDDGTVQAITSDGTTAWTADVSQAERIIPDFQGGLVAIGQNSIWKLDGITGQPYPAYTPSAPWQLGSPASRGLVAVHTDGTIFTLQSSDWPAVPARSVVGIDPTTGTQKFSVPVVDSGGGPISEYEQWGDVSQPNGPIIAGDGYAYFAYIYRSSDCVLETLEVIRISISGAYDNIKILDLPANTCEWDWLHASIITNADTGVLLTWTGTSDQGQTWASGVVTVTGTSASLISVPQMPGQYSLVKPVLQAQDGSFVGTVDTESGSNMIAFDASGNVRWMVPNEQPQIATDDGGVIGQSGITYDSNGNATGQMGLPTPTQSWRGNWYQDGDTQRIAGAPFCGAESLAPQVGANPSGNNTASRSWCFALSFQNNFTFTPEDPNGPNYSLTADISYLAATIKAAALKELKDAYLGVPVKVVEGTKGDVLTTVLNSQNLVNAPDCGSSMLANNRIWQHQVDYLMNMLNAQTAYNVDPKSAQEESVLLANRLDVIRAIGRGLGVSAAHEIAHQFVDAPPMDDNPATDSAARGTFNATGCNASTDPSPWTGYWPVPVIFLHWEPSASSALGQALGGGWHKLPGQ
jgi:hypothetical protein